MDTGPYTFAGFCDELKRVVARDGRISVEDGIDLVAASLSSLEVSWHGYPLHIHGDSYSLWNKRFGDPSSEIRRITAIDALDALAELLRIRNYEIATASATAVVLDDEDGFDAFA